jgi:nitrate reductase beta subunit
LTAGDVEVIRGVLLRLTAMRMHMRNKTVGGMTENALLQASGLTASELERMARLFGVAKYNERFVIPTGQREMDNMLPYQQGACSIEELAPPEGPGALIGWDS